MNQVQTPGLAEDRASINLLRTKLTNAFNGQLEERGIRLQLARHRGVAAGRVASGHQLPFENQAARDTGSRQRCGNRGAREAGANHNDVYLRWNTATRCHSLSIRSFRNMKHSFGVGFTLRAARTVRHALDQLAAKGSVRKADDEFVVVAERSQRKGTEPRAAVRVEKSGEEEDAPGMD